MSIGDIVKDIEYSSYYFDIRHNFSIDRDGFPKSWSDHGLSTGHLHPLADAGHDRDSPPHPGPPLRLLHPRVPDLPVPAGGIHTAGRGESLAGQLHLAPVEEVNTQHLETLRAEVGPVLDHP